MHSQLLIGRASVKSGAPFSIIVVLFAAALVLVSTTRAEPPQTTVAEELPYGQLLRAAPVAFAGAGLSGFITGAFYALVPAWMRGEGIERTAIGLFMVVTLMGGLAFQVPVGRLSDRFDRRIVLAGLGLGFAAAAIVAVRLPCTLFAILPVAVLLGGLMSTLYPICVAHAHDRMPLDKVLVVSSRLILVSGIGSVIGPLIGSSLKPHFGIDGVFNLMAAAALTLALVAVRGSMVSASTPHLERPFDILAPQAAALAHDPGGASEDLSQSDHVSTHPSVHVADIGLCRLGRRRSRVRGRFNRASCVSRASRNACFKRMRRDAWTGRGRPVHDHQVQRMGFAMIVAGSRRRREFGGTRNQFDADGTRRLRDLV